MNLSAIRLPSRAIAGALVILLAASISLVVSSSRADAAEAYNRCQDESHKAYRSGNVYLEASVPGNYIGGGEFTQYCFLNYQIKANYAVAALQVTLNQCYSKNLDPDGVFGNMTRNALIQVQKKIGVTADGIYGPNTRNAMKWAAGDYCLNYSVLR